MKDQTHTLCRRGLILGLLALPVTVQAHAGHGVAHVVSHAEAVRVRDNTVAILLTVFNAGTEPVTLEQVAADEASDVLVPGGKIASGALVEFRVQLSFEHNVPNIFTVMLDFGQDGQGPVVVMV
ncbi:hypothetical protein [Shimia sp.]|uniref:hypothetical protein n=1 Tax=Shimia sp. TaxID=1954381 RepID=UPI003299BCAC